jgi:hypothetical protein
VPIGGAVKELSPTSPPLRIGRYVTDARKLFAVNLETLRPLIITVAINWDIDDIPKSILAVVAHIAKRHRIQSDGPPIAYTKRSSAHCLIVALRRFRIRLAEYRGSNWYERHVG